MEDKQRSNVISDVSVAIKHLHHVEKLLQEVGNTMPDDEGYVINSKIAEVLFSLQFMVERLERSINI